MNTHSIFTVTALAAALVGCGTVPQPNAALDRAHASYELLQGDPKAVEFAGPEMTQAREALGAADAARARGDTLRSVDHFAYLAQQRVAIAREATSAKTWDKAAADAKAGGVGDKAAREVAAARLATQAKGAELAVANAGALQDKARAAELEMQLKALGSKQTDRGDVITLGDVLFDSNRAELRAGGVRDMGKLVEFMKNHPKRTAMIEGFTDSQGTESGNFDLSTRRAETLRMALIDQGVTADRLRTRGYGEAYPIASNSSAAGRQMNRRVEIVLSDENGVSKPR
jgi:outer membrane protein OmpA-like peptidoglycan-associated protein